MRALVTIYIVLIMMAIVFHSGMTNTYYDCSKKIRYNLDIIFPARAITCWLLEEIK